MKSFIFRNITWLLLLLISATVTNSCVKQEPVLMGSSAKLSDSDITKMKSKASRGDWHAASRLYSHYAFYERREASKNETEEVHTEEFPVFKTTSALSQIQTIHPQHIINLTTETQRTQRSFNQIRFQMNISVNSVSLWSNFFSTITHFSSTQASFEI
jgi:hypothetical protein